jgi:hypothetical protein
MRAGLFSSGTTDSPLLPSGLLGPASISAAKYPMKKDDLIGS